MTKYLIPVAILFILAGSALGTMWLHDDPSFFQMGTPMQSATFKPADMPALEIVDAPFSRSWAKGSTMTPYQLALPTNPAPYKSVARVPVHFHRSRQPLVNTWKTI